MASMTFIATVRFASVLLLMLGSNKVTIESSDAGLMPELKRQALETESRVEHNTASPGFSSTT